MYRDAHMGRCQRTRSSLICNSEKGQWVKLSSQDVLQIPGRAGMDSLDSLRQSTDGIAAAPF